MSRVITMLLKLTLLVAALPVAAQIKPITPPTSSKEPAPNPYHYVVVVNGDNVRLRKTPNINDNNIITIPLYPEKGDYLEKLGETYNFYKVRYKGNDAYISKQYSHAINNFVVVDGDDVRLRDTPDINDNNIIMIPLHPDNGDRLEYLGETKYFYKVRYKGHDAYISQKYSKKVVDYLVVVDGVNVRLRRTPEINDTNIMTTPSGNLHPEKGERLEYLGETSDFYKVRYKGYEAYISKQYSHTIVK